MPMRLKLDENRIHVHPVYKFIICEALDRCGCGNKISVIRVDCFPLNQREVMVGMFLMFCFTSVVWCPGRAYYNKLIVKLVYLFS